MPFVRGCTVVVEGGEQIGEDGFTAGANWGRFLALVVIAARRILLDALLKGKW